uniref:serine--tRNA ligase n=1 Tax=Amphimedon queenslandica TaxID=400682 RepID=A0A1X7UG07_AMPQE
MSKAIKNGYYPIATPDVIRTHVADRCGYQARSGENQYYLLANEDKCLSGTAEIPLAGMYLNKNVLYSDLPIKLVAFGRCFRVETGGRGRGEGRLYRVHQFSKVELFGLTANEDRTESEELLDEMVALQKEINTELGLHCRVLDMPTEDLGVPAYRKFDIEAWMPGLNRYGEVTSASNCTDYQSQRLNITYRMKDVPVSKYKTCPDWKYVHTVNGTACAVPRTLIALLETHQKENGSYSLPDVLGASQHVSISPSGPHIIYFGDSLELNCFSPLAAYYTWIFDDDTVENTQNLTISYKEPSDSIYGGTYICKAESYSGRYLNTSVFVAFESYFTLSPESVLAESGDNVTLQCKVTGYPIPSIFWIKLLVPVNNTELIDLNETMEGIGNTMIEYYATDYSNTSMLTFNSIEYDDFGFYACIAMQSNDSLMAEMGIFSLSDTSTVTVIETGPSITLTSVNGSDGGRYTCVALNEAGIDSATAELRVWPEILTNPNNIYTQDGEGDVSFECLADSFPSPQYCWEIFNETLNEFYAISNESERFLMFDVVEYEDNGKYRCVATAAMMSAISDEAVLTVSPDGSVEIDPSIIIATNGSTVTFTCSARGGPNNTFVWIRSNATGLIANETELMSLLAMAPVDVDGFLDAAGPLIIENGTELTLEYINATMDGGNYSCVVINEAGLGTVETTLYVAPVIMLHPEDRLVTQGEYFILSCLADAFPLPTYQWERMNRTSGYFEEITGETSSDLRFNNVDFDEFGMYRCVASSEGINDTAVSRGALVTETGPNITLTSVNGSNGGIYTCVVLNEAGIENATVELRVRPEILTNPNNIYAQNGEGDVSFECLADSFPSPQYCWEKFNETLNEFYPISNESERSLMFDVVEYEDNGRYRCVATAPTINGSAISGEAVLTVSPEGSVEIDPEFTIVTNGSTVTFTCSARGGPNNTFIWTRSNATGSMANETELMNLAAMISIDVDGFLDAAGPLIIENGTELTLEYINATRDGGNYSCVVINEAGFVAVETTLYVAPIITLHPQDQLVTLGQYFTLSCLADAFPSRMYQWERMNCTSGYFEEITAETSSDLRFNNIDFDKFGMYRCVASSEGINETAVSRGALVTG